MAGGKFPRKTSGLTYSNFPQISNVEQQGISVRKSKNLQSDRQAYRLTRIPSDEQSFESYEAGYESSPT